MIKITRETFSHSELSLMDGLHICAPFDGVQNSEDVMYATNASGALERVTKRRVWLPLVLPAPVLEDDEVDMMCAGLDVNVVKIVSWRGGYGVLAWRVSPGFLKRPVDRNSPRRESSCSSKTSAASATGISRTSSS